MVYFAVATFCCREPWKGKLVDQWHRYSGEKETGVGGWGGTALFQSHFSMFHMILARVL